MFTPENSNFNSRTDERASRVSTRHFPCLCRSSSNCLEALYGIMNDSHRNTRQQERNSFQKIILYDTILVLVTQVAYRTGGMANQPLNTP